MAKIVVYSMAYRGDVFPYVPIANELARRGHDVVYVVPREFHPMFVGEAFRCAHSGTDFGPSALDGYARYVDRWGNRLGGAMMPRLYFGQLTIPHLDALYEAIDAEVRDADLLVSHPAAALVGMMSADVRGVPTLVGDLFPMLNLSEHTALAGMPNFGRRVNRVLIRAARSRVTDPVTCGAGFRKFRQQLGLPTDSWNIMDGRLSPASNLGLVPSAYLEHQPDWPEPYRLLGFTPWAGPDDGSIDDDLAAFLDDGEPPVLVTLGTSAASARPQGFDAVLDVLDGLGARGVFLASNEDIALRLSERTGRRHAVRAFSPLAPLLPRCRAVVHSGAHGTNSLALLAGLPSVIVPCLFDQVVHARRQRELGTGIWVRRPRQLATAIGLALQAGGAHGERARAFAAEIRTEDGTVAVADEAERMLAGP